MCPRRDVSGKYAQMPLAESGYDTLCGEKI